MQGGFSFFSSWPSAASRALPAKRMQMSASHKGAHSCTQPAKDRGTRRPSLSSVTSDPLSMTRRVHTNMPHPHPTPAKEPCHSPPPAPPCPPPGCPLPADDAWPGDCLAGAAGGCGLHACSDVLPPYSKNELRERANNLDMWVCERDFTLFFNSRSSMVIIWAAPCRLG